MEASVSNGQRYQAASHKDFGHSDNCRVQFQSKLQALRAWSYVPEGHSHPPVTLNQASGTKRF